MQPRWHLSNHSYYASSAHVHHLSLIAARVRLATPSGNRSTAHRCNLRIPTSASKRFAASLFSGLQRLMSDVRRLGALPPGSRPRGIPCCETGDERLMITEVYVHIACPCRQFYRCQHLSDRRSSKRQQLTRENVLSARTSMTTCWPSQRERNSIR